MGTMRAEDNKHAMLLRLDVNETPPHQVLLDLAGVSSLRSVAFVTPWQLLMMIHGYMRWFLKKDPHATVIDSGRLRLAETSHDYLEAMKSWACLVMYCVFRLQG
jgi:hypothetical protein